MKHMHFKASCSYAALASIMELNGVDTEDYKIALEIKLPWLFSKEDGAYISGPMLQGAKWFNLWLLPRGYRIVEKAVNNAQLSDLVSEVLSGRHPICPGGLHHDSDAGGYSVVESNAIRLSRAHYTKRIC